MDTLDGGDGPPAGCCGAGAVPPVGDCGYIGIVGIIPGDGIMPIEGMGIGGGVYRLFIRFVTVSPWLVCPGAGCMGTGLFGNGSVGDRVGGRAVPLPPMPVMGGIGDGICGGRKRGGMA
jgi:hypothetical protein